MHYKSLNNTNVTANMTLLHKLAYCSKFCDPIHLMHLIMAVELYASKQGHHFLLADQNGNLPLHLVCCAPSPLIFLEVYNRRISKTTYVGLVETFLTPCMEAASKTNHLGKTPLNILMETKSELSEFNIESWRGVELLVNSNPIEANKLFTKEKMYPFMLSAIGEQANLSCTFAMLLIFVSIQNLDDLGSRIIVKKWKGKGFWRNEWSTQTNLTYTSRSCIKNVVCPLLLESFLNSWKVLLEFRLIILVNIDCCRIWEGHLLIITIKMYSRLKIWKSWSSVQMMSSITVAAIWTNKKQTLSRWKL